MAIKQINGEDDYKSSDEEPNFIDAKSKFGVKKLAVSKKAVTKQLDEDKVLKAARRVTGAADQSESEEEATKPARNEEKAPKSIIKHDAKAYAKKHQ